MISEHQVYCLLRLISYNVFFISLFLSLFLPLLAIFFLWCGPLDVWFSISEDILFDGLDLGVIEGLLFEGCRTVKGAVEVDDGLFLFHIIGMERVILEINQETWFKYIVVVEVVEAQKMDFACSVSHFFL